MVRGRTRCPAGTPPPGGHQTAGGVNNGMAGIPWWNSDIGGFLPKEYGGRCPLGPRDSAYWNNSRGTLTIGVRRGRSPCMLARRSMNIVLVRPGVGIGVEPEARPDAVVQYAGTTETVRLRRRPESPAFDLLPPHEGGAAPAPPRCRACRHPCLCDKCPTLNRKPASQWCGVCSTLFSKRLAQLFVQATFDFFEFAA